MLFFKSLLATESLLRVSYTALSLVNKIEIFDFKKKRKVLAVVNSNSTVDKKNTSTR